MNLQDILKQFKNIEPDAAYSAHSKRSILALEPKTHERWSLRRTILTVIETGAAVALTVFFVFVVLGGFGSKLAPVQYAAIDPASLHAEAQAIDMQIRLAQLNYAEPAAESTAPVTSVSPSSSASGATTPTTALGLMQAASSTGASATSSASSTMTLDQALKALGR